MEHTAYFETADIEKRIVDFATTADFYKQMGYQLDMAEGLALFDMACLHAQETTPAKYYEQDILTKH